MALLVGRGFHNSNGKATQFNVKRIRVSTSSNSLSSVLHHAWSLRFWLNGASILASNERARRSQSAYINLGRSRQSRILKLAPPQPPAGKRRVKSVTGKRQDRSNGN